MLKKIMIGGGLSLCLFLGVILYHHKEIKQEEQEESLSKENLCESKNQNGYPMSNFGVSISSEKIMTSETEVFEFEIKNESTKVWNWKSDLYFDKEKNKIEANNLEIKIDEIWYQVPFRKDGPEMINLIKRVLFPGSTTTVSVCPGLYRKIIPGNYRFTIIIYDDDLYEFKISSEFLVVEEE